MIHETAELQKLIATISSGNGNLLKRTFDLREDVSTVTSPNSSHHYHYIAVFERLLFHLIHQLSSSTVHDNALNHLLFNVLEFTPNFTQKLLHENIRCLLQQLNPHKNRSVVEAAKKFVTLVTLAKNLILGKTFHLIYCGCGFNGANPYVTGFRICRKYGPFSLQFDDLMDFIIFSMYLRDPNHENPCSISVTTWNRFLNRTSTQFEASNSCTLGLLFCISLALTINNIDNS